MIVPEEDFSETWPEFTGFISILGLGGDKRGSHRAHHIRLDARVDFTADSTNPRNIAIELAVDADFKARNE